MKWHTGRFRAALKILFELRREFKDIEGDAKVLLYRIDEESDGIAVIGSFVGLERETEPNEEAGLFGSTRPKPGALREFALAIESYTPGLDLTSNVGVRIWFGDQALCRAMKLPIDGKANRLEFPDPDLALSMIKDLMFAEASFVTLRGDNEEED